MACDAREGMNGRASFRRVKIDIFLVSEAHLKLRKYLYIAQLRYYTVKAELTLERRCSSIGQKTHCPLRYFIQSVNFHQRQFAIKIILYGQGGVAIDLCI
jgi:hypothetical protein